MSSIMMSSSVGSHSVLAAPALAVLLTVAIVEGQLLARLDVASGVDANLVVAVHLRDLSTGRAPKTRKTQSNDKAKSQKTHAPN